LVYIKDFAAYGRIEVACGLDGLNNADRAALLHLLADLRELNKGYVAELFLRVVCYSNGSDTVLDADILVILAVSNRHDLDFACAVYFCVFMNSSSIPAISSALVSSAKCPASSTSTPAFGTSLRKRPASRISNEGSCLPQRTKSFGCVCCSQACHFG